MKNQGRRKFIKQGLQVGAGLSFLNLANCAAIDRVILGEDNPDPKQIAIIGAGLAGLSSAYFLKKQNFPFRVYEGSSRLGGRVLTLNDFNSASQSADLGGEIISSLHGALFRLCKELSVPVIEQKLSESDFAYFESGQRVSLPLTREIKEVQLACQRLRADLFRKGSYQLSVWNRDELPKAVKQDLTSAEEYVRGLKISSATKSLISRTAELRWGTSLAEVSSLQLIYLLSPAKDFSAFNQDRIYRISSGSGLLTQSLYDRISGVVPSKFIRPAHVLTEVDETPDGFVLKFNTSQGLKVVLASQVICTLPFSCLKNIRGLERLTLREPVRKCIQQLKYSALSKGVLSFVDRPWNKLGIKRWSGNFESQNFWESEPRSNGLNTTVRSLATFQLGGDSAKSAGLHSIDQAIKDLNLLKLATGYENIGRIQNWSLSKWSLGGVSYFGPGTTAEFAGLFAEPDGLGKWFFAGEHTSLQWPGTMNGAIESAESVTQKITQKKTNEL